MDLDKASIVITGSKGEEGETIEAIFNPTEYTITHELPWNESHTQGSNVPDVTFVSGTRRKLHVELFFDSLETDKEITEITQKIEDLMLAKEQSDNTFRPPYVIFRWGKLNFLSVLESCVSRYTKFDSKGTPLRCIMRCIFSEVALSNSNN